MRKFLLVILVMVLVYNTALFYVNIKISEKENSSPYDSCHKIWASRGVYITHEEQNSLESLQRAFANGFNGVEIDFYYDEEMHKFILSHNRPKKDKDGTLQYTLKNGKLLTLEEVFQKVGKDHYFWLDYKNLDRLSSDATTEALKRLEEISTIYNLKERIYIEGSTPFLLSRYTKEGFLTLFAMQPLKESSILTSISSNVIKIVYYFFDFSAVAMPYGHLENPKYNHTTEENLQGVPTFLFHVPDDAELLHRLVDLKDVKVMLVGRDQSINRATITSCKNQEK